MCTALGLDWPGIDERDPALRPTGQRLQGVGAVRSGPPVFTAEVVRPKLAASCAGDAHADAAVSGHYRYGGSGPDATALTPSLVDQPPVMSRLNCNRTSN